MSSDVYQIITNRIIERLASGKIRTWRAMWRGGESSRNLITKKAYRGINCLLLSSTPYTSPDWLTFNQARELGGRIRKGAKSELVIFWKTFSSQGTESEATSHTDSRSDNRPTRPPVLRYYHLFNYEQTEGLERYAPEQSDIEPETFTPIERAAHIIKRMPHAPTIRHDAPRAYYSPVKDYVNLPQPEAFYTPEDYYAVAFHELTHATGHQTRLNRAGVAESDALAPFGSPDYSREELVAELGSAFVCAEAGITTTLENSAAYLDSWLQALKADARLIVTAASAAQAACDFILDRYPAPGPEAE